MNLKQGIRLTTLTLLLLILPLTPTHSQRKTTTTLEDAQTITGKKTFSQLAITDTKVELSTDTIWGNDVEGSFDVYNEVAFNLVITQTAISSSGRGIGMHSGASVYSSDSNGNYYFSGLSMQSMAGYYITDGEQLLVGSANWRAESTDFGTGKLPLNHEFAGIMATDHTITIGTGHATKDIVAFTANGVIQMGIDKDGSIDPLKATEGRFFCPGGPSTSDGFSLCYDPTDPDGGWLKFNMNGEDWYVLLSRDHP